MNDDENASIARLEEEARERAGPQLARDLRVVLAALKRETELANAATAHLRNLDNIHDALRRQLTSVELAAQLSQRLFELAELATI